MRCDATDRAAFSLPGSSARYAKIISTMATASRAVMSASLGIRDMGAMVTREMKKGKEDAERKEAGKRRWKS